jgi:hypothetical protein
VPTLADERAFYDRMGWSRTASNEEFVFSSDPGALSQTSQDIHDDDEHDILWVWQYQATRYAGTASATLTANHRNRWLAYFKDGVYRSALPTVHGDLNPPTAADPMCHTCGWGLVLYGQMAGDSAAIAEAEAIADIALTQVFDGTTSSFYPGNGHDMGYGGGRNRSKTAILIAYLAEATGKAKWVGWRNALIDGYLNASTYVSVNTPFGAGGAYMCDLDWMDNNGQLSGYVGNTAVSYSTPDAAWSAGVRSNASYQIALHNEFLWRSYLSTGRADLRTRIIALARFFQHYAHDPAQTTQGGPFVGGYFGVRLSDGARWHRDLPGAAQYDITVVNTLVWGYKLTGDTALLDRAKIHMRNATMYLEETPPNGGPQVAANQVWMFLDTHREHFGDSTDKHFAFNKGQLPYCYQILENGGNPTVL